ncbi:MAG: tyrosine-type recombinase/integrase [Candidatus Brocadiae bacterium]|nr:tyrosine-type recombinase/integrase [Candidatus Brocadiia bacterium]
MPEKPIQEKKGFRLHFCVDGIQYKHGRLKNKQQAEFYQSRVNFLVMEYKAGALILPPNISLPKFIFSKAMSRCLFSTNIQQTNQAYYPIPFFPPDCGQVANHSLPIQSFEQPYLLSSQPVSHSSCPDITFYDFTEKYFRMTIRKKAISTHKTEVIHIRHLQKFFEYKGIVNPLLKEMDLQFFEEYKIYRYEIHKVRTDTVNKELGTFQVIFEKACPKYLSSNVLKKLERDPSDTPGNRFKTGKQIEEELQKWHHSKKQIKELRRFRFLETQEIQKLIEMAQGHWLQPIIIVCSYTGMRRGELMKLTWQDVDMNKRLIWVRSEKQSKKKKETIRCIPMNTKVAEAFSKQKSISCKSRWVFPGTDGNQIKPSRLRELEYLVQGTDFEGIGWHTLRHSLSSNLATKGVDNRIIDSILGHQTEAMRMHYQHVFPGKVEEAINCLE